MEQNIIGTEDDSLDSDYASKIIALDDESWKSNLHIDVLSYTPNKKWEKCKDKFQALVKDTLEIDKEVDVDQCNHVRRQN